MASFQVTPRLALAECTELNFQSLYMRFTPRGPNANQTTVIENKQGPIGAGIIVNNWAVYDGPDTDAKVVARAQGLHVQASNWHNSFSLVFENEGFSGSTLQVMGISVVEPGEWAIVGGTGQFAMASGVISKRFHEQKSDGRVFELTIHAFCPLIKGSRYPTTKIGPWGGDGGSAQDITEAPKELESVTIRCSSYVHSIEFSYIDYAGQKRTAGPWGSSNSDSKSHTIQLASSEFVTEVSGTLGSHGGHKVVTSIKLVTNLQTFGPLGDETSGSFFRETPTPFTVPVQPGNAVVGFYGRSGSDLDAIGVYVRPL